jgi:hypothetical protein
MDLTDLADMTESCWSGMRKYINNERYDALDISTGPGKSVYPAHITHIMPWSSAPGHIFMKLIAVITKNNLKCHLFQTRGDNHLIVLFAEERLFEDFTCLAMAYTGPLYPPRTLESKHVTSIRYIGAGSPVGPLSTGIKMVYLARANKCLPADIWTVDTFARVVWAAEPTGSPKIP